MYVDFYHCFWRLIDFPSWCVLHDGSSIYFIYKALSCKHLVEFIVSPRWSNRITWVTTPLHLGANALSPRWNNKRRQTKDKHSASYVFLSRLLILLWLEKTRTSPNAYSSSINLTDEWTMLQSIYSHAGCDHLRYCRILGHWCFNPHTHVGCDILYLGYITWYWRFQSTHPRRVWPRDKKEQTLAWLFQSTHPRRVWHSIDIRLPLPITFQSTHPRRVWLSSHILCLF